MVFAITADQISSRTGPDLVAGTLDRLNARGDLLLPAERTAGDELQLLVAEPGAALEIVLELSRAERWSIGCGAGEVLLPASGSVREAAGDALVAARDAVERAKRKPTRFALAGPERAGHAEALIDLLLALRAKRSAEGWQLTELLATGMTQAAAAAALGITPQAASDRAIAAAWKIEVAAVAPLTEVLARLDS